MLASSGRRKQLKMSRRPGASNRPPSALGQKRSGISSMRATGAWNSGRSGIMPVALATTAISQRSGTERCESEVSMARRLPTTSSAGRSPNCHSEPMPGVAISCFWPGQSTMSRAGS